jgi:hypothetical protein
MSSKFSKIAVIVSAMICLIYHNAYAQDTSYTNKLRGVPVRAGPADSMPCIIDQPILDGSLQITKYILICRNGGKGAVERVKVFASDIEFTAGNTQGQFSPSFYQRISSR